ncbi:hypothetical protein ZZ1p0232 [Acinetobacter phage ZZ1]|jgi:hypothetical protein|uniref:Uncharacterized protein n=3 Tax=Caudoviricetes TaxID=2731619 RepID=A0A410T5N3_9CAUD|nr:hypothetical protein ZZ1p0232 [Acinetobacter phage ZZ1]AFL47687.1 hypothetical protein ZZ1p0232 [Acinetobacter phage ZZ1]QAU04055.1 hypothetical protein Henu6_gp41 [Acinetobacter phage Henu6]
MNKFKAIIPILVLMTEFWCFGIPAAGGFGALAYLVSNDPFFASAVFAWALVIYFALEYSDAKTKLESKK